MSWGSGPSRPRRAGRSGADDDDDGGFEQLARGKSSGAGGADDGADDTYTRTSELRSRARKSPGTRSGSRTPAARDDSTEDGWTEKGASEDGTTASTQAAGPQMHRGPSLKARAVGFLSRRDYARKEIASKLKPHADSEDELNKVLDDLEREGWLSTERFAQSLVHRRAERQGAARIVQELRAKGVDESQVSELRENLRATEYERARAVWDKRFGELPADRAAYAKQARFLTGRGFASDVIRRILGGNDDEE
ncbi:recombination regulator RecX [Bordetella sp. LUAb4]|uniref:recombination regulator RecX n=1 Tax=Bordetella sp. LUAb4 TaxID=2843195 RepID=UPI001E3A433E|nr:recombination regulator RecX [Bordetella sp. LUAb4]